MFFSFVNTKTILLWCKGYALTNCESVQTMIKRMKRRKAISNTVVLDSEKIIIHLTISAKRAEIEIKLFMLVYLNFHAKVVANNKKRNECFHFSILW